MTGKVMLSRQSDASSDLLQIVTLAAGVEVTWRDPTRNDRRLPQREQATPSGQRSLRNKAAASMKLHQRGECAHTTARTMPTGSASDRNHARSRLPSIHTNRSEHAGASHGTPAPKTARPPFTSSRIESITWPAALAVIGYWLHQNVRVKRIDRVAATASPRGGSKQWSSTT